MDENSKSGDKGNTSGTINPPGLTPALTVKTRAIKDAAQARNIITNLKSASREANVKNARIMAKYNSERPYTQAALENEGLAWKSNFTTKPLPMLIDKVAPRFVRAIDGVKYLTNSALPDDQPGAAKKTEAFRREITSTIRARPGWSNLISEIAQENALFGFTCVARLDEFGWFPKHFRQDCCFVPTGTKQLANSAQVVALRESFLIHELFELISDKEAAKTAGWDVANAVRVINQAIPLNRRSTDSDWERVYEDLVREANVGLSHESGPLAVTVWHLLATEVTGKVSHYIFTDEAPPTNKDGSRDNVDTLFERDDRFESMAEAMTFFSFQTGNGTLHGSKGIGREIYSMASMLDRARNEVVDRLNLAGKLIIQGDDKALRRFKMSVVGNALLIGQAYQISERKIDAGVEPFLELDTFLTSLLDQMAGATTPKVFEGERVTKAQVDLFASREEESRDNIIGRFLNQFADLMTMMQKRLCNPHTSEKDAKEMQRRLLELMTREELDKLANQPVAETVRDYTEMERQQIVLISQEAQGNPLYNQRELHRRKLTAQVNEEFADAVLLPEEDPTIVAEQTRLQQMELLILVGQAANVPVSPRDNHLVHLEVMHPAMEAAATEAIQSGAGGLAPLQAMLAHAESHVQAASQLGIPASELQEANNFVSQLRVAVEKMNALEQEQAKIPGQQPTAEPPGAAPAPPGQTAPPPVPLTAG